MPTEPVPGTSINKVPIRSGVHPHFPPFTRPETDPRLSSQETLKKLLDPQFEASIYGDKKAQKAALFKTRTLLDLIQPDEQLDVFSQLINHTTSSAILGEVLNYTKRIINGSDGRFVDQRFIKSVFSRYSRNPAKVTEFIRLSASYEPMVVLNVLSEQLPQFRPRQVGTQYNDNLTLLKSDVINTTKYILAANTTNDSKADNINQGVSQILDLISHIPDTPASINLTAESIISLLGKVPSAKKMIISIVNPLLINSNLDPKYVIKLLRLMSS